MKCPPAFYFIFRPKKRFTFPAMHVIASLKRMLEGRWAGVVCVLIAVVNKSLVAWWYSSLKADKALYLLFAKNFLQTGVMADQVSAFENGRYVLLYDPAVISPLYPLICVPFLWLTNSYFITQFLASVLSLLLLFSGLLQLAYLVFNQKWTARFFVLCTGFFLYPFEQLSVSKDFCAAGFCVWSVVLLCRFYQSGSNWRNTVLLAGSIGCLCLCKLLYVPLACLLALLTMVLALEKRSRPHLLHTGFCLLLLCVIGVAAELFIFQSARQLASSSALGIPGDGTSVTAGFFPSNLLQAKPFLISSVINTNFWGVQLESLLHIPYTTTLHWFLVLDGVLLLLLITAMLAMARKLWRSKALLLPVLLSAAMTAVVFYLSLTRKALSYKSTALAWTWLSDVRSFFLVMLTLQLLLFYFTFIRPKAVWFGRLLMALFLFECLHGIYFTAKEVATTPAIPEVNVANDAVKQLTGLLQQSAIEKNELILVTSDRALRRYAQVHNLKAYSFTTAKADLSWIKKGDAFLVVTHAVDSAMLTIFPPGSLVREKDVPPFVVHTYQQK